MQDQKYKQNQKNKKKILIGITIIILINFIGPINAEPIIQIGEVRESSYISENNIDACLIKMTQNLEFACQIPTTLKIKIYSEYTRNVNLENEKIITQEIESKVITQPKIIDVNQTTNNYYVVRTINELWNIGTNQEITTTTKEKAITWIDQNGNAETGILTIKIQ